MRSLRLPSLCLTAACLASAAPLGLFAQDAPAVDVNAMLRELHQIRDKQSAQSKQQRGSVLQQVNAAAGSPERAIATWEEAVRAVQFQGAAKESAAFRDWKDKEGEALNSVLGRNAARLYFMWLGLTIQRDGGAAVKDLLPQLVAYTRELVTDDQAAQALDDAIKRERDLAATVGRRPVQVQQRKATDAEVRKMHDRILKQSLGASPVVQWLRLTDFVNPEGWVDRAGDFDGIYEKIIQPEMRAQRDPHVTDYWDFKVKQEGEAAAKTKLAFDLDKFNTQRKPALLWSRAEDLIAIGQKNRGASEMFAVIKAYPQSPEVPDWSAKLEAVLVPPPPPATAATALPAGSAASASGSLPGAALPGSAPATGIGTK